jgi:hypothetical protein
MWKPGRELGVPRSSGASIPEMGIGRRQHTRRGGGIATPPAPLFKGDFRVRAMRRSKAGPPSASESADANIAAGGPYKC